MQDKVFKLEGTLEEREGGSMLRFGKLGCCLLMTIERIIASFDFIIW